MPEKSPHFRSETDADSHAVIFVENRGFFNFLMQKLLKKPRFSQVHLDEIGSFVWQKIDGKRTVKQIADLLGEHFGNAVNPLYPRCATYISMLKKYGFIDFSR